MANNSFDPLDFSGQATPDTTPSPSVPDTGIHNVFRSLAERFGARISSMDRSPAEQAALIARGATNATNSQHVKGTAADFVVPPDKQDAFMKEATKEGLQVIDERSHGGTGPHLHVQLPNGATSTKTSLADRLTSQDDSKLDVPDSALEVGGGGASGGGPHKKFDPLDFSSSETPTLDRLGANVDEAQAKWLAQQNPGQDTTPQNADEQAAANIKQRMFAAYPNMAPEQLKPTIDKMIAQDKAARTQVATDDPDRNLISPRLPFGGELAVGVKNLLGRIGANINSGEHGFEKGANTDELAKASEIVNSYERGDKTYSMDNPFLVDNSSGSWKPSQIKLPISEATYQRAKALQQQAASTEATSNQQQASLRSTFPVSQDEAALDEAKKGAGFGGTAAALMEHPLGFASKIAETVGTYALPGLGQVQAVADTHGNSLAQYLSAKGLDPSKPSDILTAMNNPEMVKEAQHYDTVATTGVALATAASMGLAKGLNTLLTKAPLSVAQKTAVNIPGQIVANSPFMAAQAASNSAAGLPNTPEDLAESAAMTVGFGAHGAISGHGEFTQHRLDMIKGDHEANNANIAREQGLAATAKQKADEEQQTTAEANSAKFDQEKAKEDAFNKASTDNGPMSAEDKAATEEAQWRNHDLEQQYQGQTRVEGVPGNLERVPVHPPEGTTPEKVQEEWQSQKDEEDARLQRVELGQLTERLRTRQQLAEDRATQEQKNQAKKEAKQQATARGQDTHRQNKAADQIIADNPGKSPEELAPLLKEALAKPAEEPTKAEAPQAPEKPVEATKAEETSGDKPMSPDEEREAARAAGAYIPDDDPLNMAGNARGEKSEEPIHKQTLRAFIKLHSENPVGADGVSAGVRSGKITITTNPESIGRKPTGQGADYDPITGRSYVYLDNVGKEGVVTHLLKAANHEGGHGLQDVGHVGDNPIVNHMFSSVAGKGGDTLAKAAQAGNKIAINALNKAAAEGNAAKKRALEAKNPDGSPMYTPEQAQQRGEATAHIEAMPHFASEAVAARRARTGLGRLTGLAADMKAAGRNFLRTHLGVDITPSIEDMAHASTHIAGEYAKAQEKNPNVRGNLNRYRGGEGDSFNMAIRNKGEGEVHESLVDHISNYTSEVNNFDPTHLAATKRRMVRQYLNKWAGTPEDPLKNIMLPDGARWEDLMDKAMYPDSTKSSISKKVYASGDEAGPVNRNNPFDYRHEDASIAATQLMAYLNHVEDHLRTIPADKLGQYDLVRAVKETQKADAEAAKRMKSARAASMKDMPVYKEYSDGMKWVQLTKPGEFAQESDVMGHSVRGYEPTKYKNGMSGNVSSWAAEEPEHHPDWIPASGDKGHENYGVGTGGWEAIKNGSAQVYSLRDKDGNSHVTIEVHNGDAKIFGKKPGTGIVDINQIKGKQNAKPVAKYIPYVQDFVRSKEWGDVRDLHNTDLMDSHQYGSQIRPDTAYSKRLNDALKSSYGEHRYYTTDQVDKARESLNRQDMPSSDQVKSMFKDDEPLNMAGEVHREPGEPVDKWRERVVKPLGNYFQEKIRSLFRSPEEKIERELYRQAHVGWLAHNSRMYSQAEKAFDSYKKYFDKIPSKDQVETVDQWETGKKLSDPMAEEFFKSINPVFMKAINVIQKLDPGSLANLRERYMAHVWEKPARATAFFQTKGPLAGDKAFLKAQRWTLKSGIEEGKLKPITTNPAELAMLKMSELTKYAGLLELRQEMIDRGWARKAEHPTFPLTEKEKAAGKTVGKRMKQSDFVEGGWKAVNDNSFNGYVVKEDIANDINGYLNRGLSNFSTSFGLKGVERRPFDDIRAVKNSLVALKLGWSGFHAGFTTADTFVQGMEVAMRRAFIGDLRGSVKGFTRSLGSAGSLGMLSAYEGGQLKEVWRSSDPKLEAEQRSGLFSDIDEHTAALLDALEKGGARLNMDPSEWNHSLQKEIQAWRQRNPTDIARHSLGALTELASMGIHTKLVPAQKMASRMVLMKFELDRFADKLNKEIGDYNGILEAMHPDAIGRISRKVNNLVDDRLGHMAYDNQFWNKYLFHIGQILTISPGWVVGGIRTALGGVKDITRLIAPEKLGVPLDKEGKITDAKFGRLTSRTSNLIMLTALTMAASGVFQYLVQGTWPESLKDYVHPKTGRKNLDGTDERIAWPTYAKEHYAMLTNGWSRLGSKINSPLVSTLWELGHNADYSNTQIVDPDADRLSQAKQIAKYLGKSFAEPIVGTYLERGAKLDANNPNSPALNAGLKAASMIGITPARKEVDQSDLEQFLSKKYFDSLPQGSKTQAAEEEFQKKAADEAAMRRGESIDTSDYSAHQLKTMKGTAREATYTQYYKKISNIEDRLKAWDMATPEERDKYDMRKVLLHGARTEVRNIPDPDVRARVQAKIEAIRQGDSQ